MFYRGIILSCMLVPFLAACSEDKPAAGPVNIAETTAGTATAGTATAGTATAGTATAGTATAGTATAGTATAGTATAGTATAGTATAGTATAGTATAGTATAGTATAGTATAGTATAGTATAGTATAGTATAGTATAGTATAGTATAGTATAGTATAGTATATATAGDTGGTGGDTGGTAGDTGGDTGGETDEVVGYVTPPGIAACSVDDIKGRVDFDMRDYYIYYDQVPTLNLANYDSGNALIQDLRVDPDIYSSVGEASTQDALFNEGEKTGYGFIFQPSSDGVVRFRYIDLNSPADNAGILRGDEIVTFQGKSMADITNEDLNAVFGAEVPPLLTMSIRTGDEAPRDVSVSSETFRWVTAAALQRFTPQNDTTLPTIGYMSIRIFLATTQAEIDFGLQQLEDAGGVDELIIDLRYNGGGRTSVAQYLASVVGGAAVEGKVLLENRLNDKYSEFNSTVLFEKVEKPLNSPRVFVLTTGNSASSSEIFINALKPYIDVVVIGDTTAGKPFTSIPMEYCDKSINAMLALRVNSAGVSVAGGIAADCPVTDDWTTIAETVEDPLVSAALTYASQGRCPTPIAGDIAVARTKAPAGPTYMPKDEIDIAIDDKIFLR